MRAQSVRSNLFTRTLGVGVVSLLLLTLAAFTLPADDPVDLPSACDFDGDQQVDAVKGEPFANATPGVVEIRSGSSNLLIVRMMGRSVHDRFGESAAVVGDVSGDGIDDLVIGAPQDGNGHAFVFAGPFASDCTMVIDAANANMILKALPDEYDFGFATAVLYDIDNDQIPEILVAAKLQGAQSQIVYRTSIFSGWTGNRIATLTGAGPFAALVPIDGDTDYDADVDQDDLVRVVANLGLSGELTRYDGDGNDDGIVNSHDLETVIAQFGLQTYDTLTALYTSSSQPDNVIVVGEPPIEYRLIRTHPDNGIPIASLEFGSQAVGITPFPGSPCTALLVNCLNDPRVTEALALFDARCYGQGGGAPRTVGTIYCKACPPGQPSGLTTISCGLFGRKVEIILCDNAPDFCATLAHEITHVSQACAAGLFRDCTEYKRWAKNQAHRMCAEMEALMIGAQCVNLTECCGLACESSTHSGGWRDCSLSCSECCVQGSWNCCLSGRNTCLDNGANPCGP